MGFGYLEKWIMLATPMWKWKGTIQTMFKHDVVPVWKLEGQEGATPQQYKSVNRSKFHCNRPYLKYFVKRHPALFSLSYLPSPNPTPHIQIHTTQVQSFLQASPWTATLFLCTITFHSSNNIKIIKTLIWLIFRTLINQSRKHGITFRTFHGIPLLCCVSHYILILITPHSCAIITTFIFNIRA